MTPEIEKTSKLLGSVASELDAVMAKVIDEYKDSVFSAYFLAMSVTSSVVIMAAKQEPIVGLMVTRDNATNVSGLCRKFMQNEENRNTNTGSLERLLELTTLVSEKATELLKLFEDHYTT